MRPRDFDLAHETERARSALWHLDAGCPRPEWVRLGMAAKAAGLTFEDWHAWSETAGNYRNEADCRTTWASMKGEGIGAGTLFAAARAAGWQDSTGRSLPPAKHLSDGRPVNRQTEDTAERARTAQERQAPRREGKGTPADPAALWSRFLPAPAAHGYLTRKGMAPDGLRIASAGLTIAGHDCAGWLALPVWSIEHGELQSLQLASPEAGPPKLSLQGCRIAGGARWCIRTRQKAAQAPKPSRVAWRIWPKAWRPLRACIKRPAAPQWRASVRATSTPSPAPCASNTPACASCCAPTVEPSIRPQRLQPGLAARWPGCRCPRTARRTSTPTTTPQQTASTGLPNC